MEAIFVCTRWLVRIACFLIWAQLLASQDVPVGESAPIAVKISVANRHIHVGQDVHLRVEIWNKGTKDVFISKNIETTVSNALAVLDLTLYYGNTANRPKFSIAADSLVGGRFAHSSLAAELSKYWITLPPDHFYGGEVVMLATWFTRLSVPGKYRIQGKYRSRGLLAQDINNPILHYADEAKHLPYESWSGQVDTNSVWIEVTKD